MHVDSTTSRPPVSGLLKTLAESFGIFNRRARRQLIALLALMIGGAILEALGAALIVPFIAVINDSSYLTSHPLLRNIYSRSTLATPELFITVCAMVLLAFFVFKNLYLSMMASAQFYFIYKQMPHFSSELFSKYMLRPLTTHVQTNSAEMIRNVSNEVFMFFTNFLIPAMTLLTELLVLLSILIVLLSIAPLSTLIAMVMLGGSTKLFYSLVRKRIRRYGQLQQQENAERIKWVKQGLGSIKETKVLGREQYFTDQFRCHEELFSQSARYAMTLNQTPRLFIETIAFAALFLGVGIALMIGQDRASVLPVLALFAVAAVRLLPSLNRILLSITRMAYYRPAAEIVLEANREKWYHSPVTTPTPCHIIRDWQEIRFDKVCFTYPGGCDVLVDLNLSIHRGTSVALIGPSGSGKTTIADLSLGLLIPTSGRILIDDTDIQSITGIWRRHLGYIPQSIYLLDDSIRRNVAFALPDNTIDDAKVWAALRLARLEEYVHGLPDKLSASVGENGGKLSGGQRQRLGIARALYDDPDFIVLDEATSALDEATEREIADTLEGLNGLKTLLVIAHRPETIRRCTYRYAVDQQAFIS
jgi:ATP-binding cassette, subfamily B, bacterial PglK